MREAPRSCATSERVQIPQASSNDTSPAFIGFNSRRRAHPEGHHMIALNSTVQPEDRERATRQLDRVLNRLREGPATTGDFLRMKIGRFGARIGELRKAGYKIARYRSFTGDHVYILVSGGDA